jgi:hypothetical protein
MKKNNLKTIKNRKSFLIIIGIFLFYSSFVFSQCNVTVSNSFTLSYGSTNAINLLNEPSVTVFIPSADSGTITVNQYTFTIPFFETNFQTSNLSFSNAIGFNACNCPRLVEIHNSFNISSVIASSNSTPTLNVPSTLSVGIHDYKAVAKCNGVVFKTNYFRIIIQKEVQPTINMSITPNCQVNNIGNATGWFDFLVNGTMPVGSTNLYLRTIKPSGSTCNSLDKLVSQFSTNQTISNHGFFSCNTNGQYTVKLVYKKNKIGGGSYNNELNGYGWSNFIWTKTYQHCTPNFPPEPIRRFSSQIDNSLNGKIVISPNPSNGIFTINGDFIPNQSVEIDVYDLQARSVVKKTIANFNNDGEVLDLKNQSSGTYIISIIQGSTKITQTIIKE